MVSTSALYKPSCDLVLLFLFHFCLTWVLLTAIGCTLLWQSELTEEELKVIVTHVEADYSDFLTMLGWMLV
jgi:hypothetical protein